MAVYEIPLAPTPRRFSIDLGGNTYNLRVFFANVDEGGWALDISDSNNNPVLCGIPLVTGCDLLAPYAYLNIGGTLFVTTDGNLGAVPTFTNLGVNSHLYFEVD